MTAIDGSARHERARDDVSGAVDSDLRADVRYLGNLLGRVLRENGGDELLHDVESLRAAVIDAYEGDHAEGAARAQAIVSGMSAERAEAVAQAFTTYFHLTNLAEEHHRVRVLRQRGDDGGVPGDSFPATYAELVAEVGEAEAAERLRTLRFHPVLTAHPTEARRRAVTTGVRRITDLIDERDRARNATARAENERRLLEEITTLLRTSPLRTTRPTPLDEVRTAMSVFDQTLFEIVPQVYRLLDDRLQGDDAGRAPVIAPAFVRFGTWIGGDRDGNPHVTADVTRQAAEIAAEHILLGLARATTRIGSALTLDASDTPADAGLTALVAAQESLDPGIAERIGVRAPNETHRRALLFVAARIDATRTGSTTLAYDGPEALLADLRVIQASLIAAGAIRPANGELQNLLWQVETFGFHLAELEVRQHSQVHRTALAEIRAGGELSETTEEVLAVFRTIAGLQSRSGVRAANRYIVSFTQSPADLANVHELAVAALGSAEAAPVLDVIPLFETFADLHASVDILDEAVRTEAFQRRLAATGRRLEVMLGYSDSSKDVGPVSANLALYDAQARIADWARDNDIELTLFHGRGGSLGRGGGPANEAVLAQPPGSIDGRLKLTEQGEVIFAQYGDQDIAARHLEQMASATLFASSPSNEARTAAAAARFADLAQQLDDVSRVAFYDLVKADGFAPWFARVTPMEEIGLLPLGSRPARRGLSVESLEDLRAIPWVFSWTQARINLAGWYGLGSALEAVGDVDVLRAAYAEWPLFAAMIKNVEMSLAKTDEYIARRYLELADRDDLAAKVLDEMVRTRDWVLRVSGGSDVLEDRPVLARAVRLRSPYVDALSHLQLRALRAIRTSGSTDPTDADHRLLLLTVNGIAAGLQNTG
ncbi:phosphoenolpyruvate carboxylase [Curtobacterium flaccumfaciens]|uniref:phosphoenolpyruvate carboxylase n=1 Tax=Curtobacterium flaccumfaciens TaxID=2035 RepID=UPI001BDEEC6D|nr:phosphoenolpyruvate carboxylase [Curtobacterium flaccumfaciens]MBT1596073.1 phosphoenolpyruvate carboxylase [Curtobacterium flaccumfaciens pv. flaccumfaciens]